MDDADDGDGSDGIGVGVGRADAAEEWKYFVVRSRSLLSGPLAPWYYHGSKSICQYG